MSFFLLSLYWVLFNDLYYVWFSHVCTPFWVLFLLVSFCLESAFLYFWGGLSCYLPLLLLFFLFTYFCVYWRALSRPLCLLWLWFAPFMNWSHDRCHLWNAYLFATPFTHWKRLWSKRVCAVIKGSTIFAECLSLYFFQFYCLPTEEHLFIRYTFLHRPSAALSRLFIYIFFSAVACFYQSICS